MLREMRWLAAAAALLPPVGFDRQLQLADIAERLEHEQVAPVVDESSGGFSKGLEYLSSRLAAY